MEGHEVGWQWQRVFGNASFDLLFDLVDPVSLGPDFVRLLFSLFLDQLLVVLELDAALLRLRGFFGLGVVFLDLFSALPRFFFFFQQPLLVDE